MAKENNIDRYLDGHLSGEELKAFQMQLHSDSSLAADLRLHEEINESIADDETHFLRQRVGLLIKQTARKRSMIRLVSGVAAGLVVILSVVSITHTPSPSKAFAEYYAPYQTDLNTRSAEKKLLGLNFAYKLYSEGDYAAAHELLSNYNADNSNNVSAIYYQALCALEIDLNEEAEKNLLYIVNKGDYAHALHAKWYLSMLYLKTERFSEAENYLNELSEVPNFYSARASEILKKHY